MRGIWVWVNPPFLPLDAPLFPGKTVSSPVAPAIFLWKWHYLFPATSRVRARAPMTLSLGRLGTPSLPPFPWKWLLFVPATSWIMSAWRRLSASMIAAFSLNRLGPIAPFFFWKRVVAGPQNGSFFRLKMSHSKNHSQLAARVFTVIFCDAELRAFSCFSAPNLPLNPSRAVVGLAYTAGAKNGVRADWGRERAGAWDPGV